MSHNGPENQSNQPTHESGTSPWAAPGSDASTGGSTPLSQPSASPLPDYAPQQRPADAGYGTSATYDPASYGQSQTGQTQPQYGESQYGQTQPQYGQTQYGQTQYGQNQYGQPYGTTTQPGMQPQGQYGTSAYGMQGYNPAYPGTYAQGPDKALKWGRIGFCCALAALIIGAVFSVLSGQALVDLYHATGGMKVDTSHPETLPPAAEGPAVRFGLYLMLQIIPTILGILGLVFSGMGLANVGKKLWAGIGLAVALLAPLICYGIFSAVVAPAVAR